MKAVHFTFVSLIGFAACGGADHIRPHVDRHRNYDPGEFGDAPQPISEGSIFTNTSRGLFADFRATNVGDIVTIRIDETPNASGAAGTDMERSSSSSLAGNIPTFGIMDAIRRTFPAGELDDAAMTTLFNILSESNFDADGNTSRSSRVQANIAVRVKRVMPNGDLFVEGTKIMMVNEEELHIYISGAIRAEDIEHDNSVASSLVADAQIEFTGTGPLDRNQEQGWLSRLLSIANPM